MSPAGGSGGDGSPVGGSGGDGVQLAAVGEMGDKLAAVGEMGGKLAALAHTRKAHVRGLLHSCHPPIPIAEECHRPNLDILSPCYFWNAPPRMNNSTACTACSNAVRIVHGHTKKRLV